ncbi:MAG: DUF29 domain-containing protein [Microcystis wesenbergii Mw_MB_S_20031200_S109]|jgi:hypothetical protein|uniref:DUF29 domain-containing protein n=1 Tax=Microcystis wesenbergii Mw_MB_S_20031200_S109D TaxID=2486241 RepID=A0A552M5Q7_9CHRO|nr:DUF29 domain-containing protein [Microcystis aeruginosa W11-03]NCR95910.1 DUF29 domain-containing protein [Microcystis aeruginosa W11-06]TRV03564.1 MAG: DUF29 domain-containing protein [Microcystis wesenbergii Mw_MB_S_20031200_S109]TRV04354.1 MAG: DUF29 domain-containing protein [Microcystis wesenbergii Mw_QC_B_20070930_S4D]TRV13921.1 MAG: DUF29 domain-containing protein [Microcystis wesenbergii Mw_QC_B_20070930_S4]TRV27750.1 MAG: DUF29 domain-containing protein [Microcystis wesenbergii Mw_
MSHARQSLSSIYEEDYQQWLDKTVLLLKNRQVDSLDYEHLIEELEALGREQKNAVESLVIQVIQHLLFYQYWSSQREDNQRHWRGELIGFRTQLELRLTTNLRNHLSNRLDYLYSKAKKMAEVKTDLKLPSENPYTLADILDEDWLPEII